MDFHTLRNVAVGGLVQVGVLVAGVLAAGACHKWAGLTGFPPPARTVLPAEYGHFGLAVPVGWAAFALGRLRRPDPDGADAPEAVAFYSGLGLILLLAAGAWWAGFGPLLRLMDGGGGCTLGLSA